MTNSRRLVIVDIGSHKLEELLVLLGPFCRQLGVYAKWAIKKTAKAVLTLNLSALAGIPRQWKVIRYYFLSGRRYNVQVVSVEPNIGVAQCYVKKLSQKVPVHYMPVAVLGHDAKGAAELKTLYFYDHSISSSIYKKKNREANDAKASVCVGLKFETIWDGLVAENIINADDPILLRMNCEGAELGVVEACVDRKLRPICIIGSIGDVDKIHGRETGDKTRQLMKDIGAPYFYFKGDDPGTWYDMIPVWEKYAGPFQ